MPSLATILQLSGPAILGIGAIAAACALCAMYFLRPEKMKPRRESPQPELTPIVDGTDMRPRALLDHTEADWQAVLEAVIEVVEEQFRLLYLVPLDRVVETGEHFNGGQHAMLKQLRVEFLVVDEENRPVLASVMAGRAPHSARGRALHATMEVLKGAGVPVIEILPDDSDEEVAAHALALLLAVQDEAVPA